MSRNKLSEVTCLRCPARPLDMAFAMWSSSNKKKGAWGSLEQVNEGFISTCCGSHEDSGDSFLGVCESKVALYD